MAQGSKSSKWLSRIKLKLKTGDKAAPAPVTSGDAGKTRELGQTTDVSLDPVCNALKPRGM